MSVVKFNQEMRTNLKSDLNNLENIILFIVFVEFASQNLIMLMLRVKKDCIYTKMKGYINSKLRSTKCIHLMFNVSQCFYGY